MEKSSLIPIINALGFAVLAIDDELYVVTSWRPAEGSVQRHILAGKLVDDKLAAARTGPLSQASQDLVNRLDPLPVVKREFSHHYPWKLYTP